MGKGTQHKNDWQPTKMQVSVSARGFYLHTVTIVSNEKVFDPKLDYNNEMRTDLVHIAKLIYMKVWSSNRITIREKQISYNQFMKRLNTQSDAINLCGDLLSLIEIAWKQFHVSTKKIHYWGSLLLKLEEEIVTWHSNDCRKFKEFKKQNLLMDSDNEEINLIQL